MKNLLLFSTILFQVLSFGQQTTLKVVGRNLTLTNGQNIVLRGVNYPLINEGSIALDNAVQYKSYIDQVALTGANAVRLPWYTNGQSWRDQTANGGAPGTMNGYVNNGHLSNIVAYCITKGMVPILSIHDDSFITCKTDWAYFNSTVMNFWTSPAIINLINTNKSKIIINLANEFDKVRWANNPVTALDNFKTNYNAAITTLRNAGITVPIMIDAPDCGQSSTELLSIAVSMNNADSQHNLIFSSHAYWGGYASTTAQIQAKLNEAQNTNVCFILGEIANNQDNNGCGDLGLYNIYPTILQESCTRNIGWLAWTFNHDCTVDNPNLNSTNYRIMTTNSNVNNLTTFGNDIINNVNYGLKSTQGCGATVLSNDQFNFDLPKITVYPNPVTDVLNIESSSTITKIAIINLLGQELISKNSNDFKTEIDLSVLKSGNYLAKVYCNNSAQVIRIVKK